MSVAQGIPPCLPYGESPILLYGYQPSLAPGIAFSVIFGLICATHFVHTLRSRAWWQFFFIIGSGLETLGWIGRTVAHNCAYSLSLSTMQVAVLIMGPAWTQAGVYVTLWVLIRLLGNHVSPLPPKTYLIICFWVDTVCLSLQAAGGGIAGTAVTKGTSTSTGTTIMVAGIISQLVCGCVFAIILGIVILRGAPQIEKNRPVLLVAVATVLSTAMMVLRGVYRSIELSQGWTGFLITHQGYVIGLDAVPMVLAMGGLAIFNPGMLFARQKASIGEREEEQSRTRDSSQGAGTVEAEEKKAARERVAETTTSV